MSINNYFLSFGLSITCIYWSAYHDAYNKKMGLNSCLEDNARLRRIKNGERDKMKFVRRFHTRFGCLSLFVRFSTLVTFIIYKVMKYRELLMK